MLIGCNSNQIFKEKLNKIECPEIFFSKEHKILIQNNENLISLDNISIKSEINNAKFDKSCSLQNNNFLSNLSVLFVVKPLIQLDHKIELPYYVAFIGDENDILDIQYFSTVGEFKKNIETKKLIETDLISSNKILFKNPSKNFSVVIGFMLDKKQLEIIN
mgnify:CR=1 FL=1